MRYWLLKSEPGAFSIDDLARSPDRTTCWDGVRNYQARNFMRDEMQVGDRAFFYHSNCPQTGVAGIVEIVREAYPDPTALDPDDKHYDPKASADSPRWYMVDVRLAERFDRIIELAEMKSANVAALKDFALLKRGNRLSVLPVTKPQWNAIISMK